MVDLQLLHDVAEWSRDLARYGSLLARKLPLPDPSAPTGRWDPESPLHQAALLQALRPKTMRLEVVGLRDETPTTKTLVLRRTDGPKPLFRAGQYLSLQLSVDGIRTSRPYSISSAPSKDVLEITVKAMPGEWVPNYLNTQVHLRDSLTTTGPKGSFYYEPITDGHDLVFLAGGSGITPFISMLSQLETEQFRGNVTLLYGSRTPQDVIFAARLEQMQTHCPWLKVHHLYSEPSARQDPQFMDAETIRRLAGQVDGKCFFICGPRGLYQSALAALSQLGVPSRLIRQEVYGPGKRPELEDGWPDGLLPTTLVPVSIEDGPIVQARAGEPLLNSLERAGVVVPAVCRTGHCGACRVKCLDGQVFVPPGVTIREADRWQGYVHACSVYPITPLTIRL